MRNEFDERSSGNTVPANIYVMSVWVSKKKSYEIFHTKKSVEFGSSTNERMVFQVRKRQFF